MGTLTIRAIPDEVKSRLRMEAARHGRSMEAEVRALLVQRYGSSDGLGSRLHARFAEIGGAEDLAEELGAIRRYDSPREVPFAEYQDDRP